MDPDQQTPGTDQPVGVPTPPATGGWQPPASPEPTEPAVPSNDPGTGVPASTPAQSGEGGETPPSTPSTTI